MELILENVSTVAAKFGTTPEVLTKFLTDAQAAAEVKPFADSLGTLEVFNADQLTQRIANERTQAATEATNTTKGNTYGAMDKRILEDTGIAKNSGELTIDYMARAAKEKYGTKVDESTEMVRVRADLKAAQELAATQATKLSEMEVTHATERKQGQINAAQDAIINALPIQAAPELLDAQREFFKYRFNQAYAADLVDGKVEYTDKATGLVVRDVKTAAPITTQALIEQFAPNVVSLKAASAKSGSGFESSSTNLNNGEASSFDFTQYSTKEEFAKALNKAGISSGSSRGTELYVAFEKARPDLK